MKIRKFLLGLITCIFVGGLFVPIGNAQVAIEAKHNQIQSGKALYREHCADCHLGLDKSEKAQRTLSRLRSSIEHFPSMNYLSFLSEADLEDITVALSTVEF